MTFNSHSEEKTRSRGARISHPPASRAFQEQRILREREREKKRAEHYSGNNSFLFHRSENKTAVCIWQLLLADVSRRTCAVVVTSVSLLPSTSLTNPHSPTRPGCFVVLTFSIFINPFMDSTARSSGGGVKI